MLLLEQAFISLDKGVEPNLIVGVIVLSVISLEPDIGGGTWTKENIVVVVSLLGGKVNCLTVKDIPLSGEKVLLESTLVLGLEKPFPVVYVSVSNPTVLLWMWFP